jgi:hypothetical protein
VQQALGCPFALYHICSKPANFFGRAKVAVCTGFDRATCEMREGEFAWKSIMMMAFVASARYLIVD